MYVINNIVHVFNYFDLTKQNDYIMHIQETPDKTYVSTRLIVMIDSSLPESTRD